MAKSCSSGKMGKMGKMSAPGVKPSIKVVEKKKTKSSKKKEY